KYFGQGKGSNIYAFLDERGMFFYSTVFTSSDRDAPYVIDGLTHSDSIKPDMHSTDTHGYTEIIFAISHLLGIKFAPRIKNIKEQVLSSFNSIKKDLESKNYQILPSYKIRKNIIKDNWELILRLVASVKTKEFKASTILKRLNSYDTQHTLQDAMKEFGRIIKSIFLLEYIDKVELRQDIEKQLNKGELANKFGNAVAFANNQEIMQVHQEDQDIAVMCKLIVQNIIILWNYIELTKIIMRSDSLEEKSELIKNIKELSIISWQHINMFGLYDFSSLKSTNDSEFEIEEILAYKAA
uniref:Tn3 family transposase n=1 Tax=Cysteiniphilum sp. 6C5 TaxID=3453128 RepID=UPI003F840907